MAGFTQRADAAVRSALLVCILVHLSLPPGILTSLSPASSLTQQLSILLREGRCQLLSMGLHAEGRDSGQAS